MPVGAGVPLPVDELCVGEEEDWLLFVSGFVLVEFVDVGFSGAGFCGGIGDSGGAGGVEVVTTGIVEDDVQRTVSPEVLVEFPMPVVCPFPLTACTSNE